MDAAKSRVTIVIPAWDDYAGAELNDALDSLLAQDCPCRILVVDNASDVAIALPESVEVIRAPRRLTLGAARNLGVQHVGTEYVLMWDADDVMLPGTLQFLLEQIAADSRLVASAVAILDADSGRRHRWPHRWTTRLVRHWRLFALLHCVWSVYPTTGATIMSTEAVKTCGGYTAANSGDDWGLGVALLFRGRVGWDERPGRLYRDTPGSIWARHSSPPHLVGHARAVRERIASDPGIPAWAKTLLPLVAAAQYTALALHEALRIGRAALRGLRG